MKLSCLLAFGFAVLLADCAQSPAEPESAAHHESSTLKINAASPEDELLALSERNIVRVGVNRAPEIPIPVGWLIFLASTGKWYLHVMLPEGWSYSLREISHEPNVVNVGDVVDIRVKKHRYYSFLTHILFLFGLANPHSKIAA